MRRLRQDLRHCAQHRRDVQAERRLVRAGYPREAQAAFRRAVSLHPMGRVDVFLAKLSPKR